VEYWVMEIFQSCHKHNNLHDLPYSLPFPKW
jgi:hypothetical protein